MPTLSLFAWLTNGGDAPDSQPDPENVLIQQDKDDEVWQAIQQLSHRLREAAVLRHWTDYSFKEMGQVLGCSPRTAQSRVRLAYQQLRKHLDPANKIYMEDSRL